MTRIRRTVKRGQLSEIRYSRGPFETEHTEEGLPLTVELCGTFVKLRLKGQRRALELTYQAMWTKACFIKAKLEAADRKRRRDERRKLRRSGRSVVGV